MVRAWTAQPHGVLHKHREAACGGLLPPTCPYVEWRVGKKNVMLCTCCVQNYVALIAAFSL